MAAEPGFEPELRDSKSLVLPLHHSAIALRLSGAEGRIRTDTRVTPQQFLRLPRLPFRHFGIPKNNGAEEEIRTPDLLLGKEAFYR